MEQVWLGLSPEMREKMENDVVAYKRQLELGVDKEFELELREQIAQEIEVLTRYKAHAYRNSPDLDGEYLVCDEVLQAIRGK